jgi:amino acid adenylation domain-containing protein
MTSKPHASAAYRIKDQGRLEPAWPGRLWIETVPEAADGPLAHHRLAAELERPLAVSGTADARAVVLSYADGLADVVVTTRDGRSPDEAVAPLLGLPVRAASQVPAEPADETDLGQEVHELPNPGLPLAALEENFARTLVHHGYHNTDGLAVLTLPGPDDPRLVSRRTRPLLGERGGAPLVAVMVVNERGTAADVKRVACLPAEARALPLALVVDVDDGQVHRAAMRHRTGLLPPESVARVAAETVGGLQATEPSAPRTSREDGIAAAVARHDPERVAVSCDGEALTYSRLNDRAEAVARGLAAAGIGRGDRVAALLERSADLPVGLLGILKAGAAYVPIDPSYPAERIAYILDDAEVRAVLTDTARELPGRTVLTLADLPEGGLSHAKPAGASDPAYIIYTSGTTGRPKGVVVPHSNVLDLVEAVADDFGLGPSQVWTQFHSTAFDFSVWEIWGCLITGGRLVVVPRWVTRSPDDFHRLLIQERVTVLSQTPSAFGPLIQADRRSAEALDGLRLVVLGGESLDPRVLLGWLDRHPESACQVVNMYGITETTVHVTAQRVTRREAVEGSRSVGRPIPGWHVRVTDEEGRPLAPGAVGEIWVSGAGVAACYQGRAALTAERFVPGPGGGRLYRSGDRGRLLPDGRLEHLGRMDGQRKIRGFRVEPDEVRAVLLEDPGVTAAAVVVRDDTVGARLDAYVVLDPTAGAETGSVRARSAAVLPDFMVPSTVTVLDALPLTANGKIDQERLPPPAGSRQSRDDDPTAETITEIWEAVLGRRVRLEDNFFDVGGNSLAAIQMVALMRERELAPVSMREFYRNPTIRGLLALADAGDQDRSAE